MWTEGHTGKEKFAQGHTGATELFRGMGVITNFHKDIHVKDFRILMRCVFLLIVYQGRDIHGRIYLNEQGINAQVAQASAPPWHPDSPNLCSKQMPSHPDS